MTAISIAGLPPHLMTCRTCGMEWDPKPTRQGPNKGQHTDASLDRAAKDHWNDCTGRTP
jgi:hypothetical protein